MQEIYGVFPGSDDYSHELVLGSSRGKKYGLKLLNGVQSIRIIPPQRQPPPVKLEQNSWHLGRGAEVWLPNANNFYDSQNAWTPTPNKLHPTLLMQWYTGFRDAEMNMPASGDTHKWVPLYAGSGSDPNRRYLDVSFTASASSNRERCFMILRKKGTPGTLTHEWRIDSGGNPYTVQKSVTKTASDLTDTTSFYVEFKPSSVLAVTASTVYHLTLTGGANDDPNNCWEVLCDSAAAGKNSSNGTSWSATAYSPYYRITDEDVMQRIAMFPFDGAWYAVTQRADFGVSKLYIHGCRGRATSGSASLLTDTGAGQYGGTFPDFSGGKWKIRIVRGAGQGQVRTIASSTATGIIPTVNWDSVPSATSEYVIYGGNSWKEIASTGLAYVSDKPKSSNGIVYFPQLDGVDIRSMRLNYANANDHEFSSEDSNHNRGWFLTPSYDSALGPVMVRGNISLTSSGVPNGKAISIGKAATSPSGTPLTFGTNLTFQPSILTGDNTYQLTGLYDHQNTLYAAKEDYLYSISGNVPVKISYGADASPNALNGAAACTGTDGQFYITAEHDVFFISGSNSYPTNLPFNLPSNRGGYVMDLTSEKAWLFAALDAGDSGWSSVMRLSLDNRSWHEQIRGFCVGRRIRSVSWLNFSDTRPHLAFECQGELLYQEMPLYGVRPQQDSGCAYQHEAVIEFATMDLLSTDLKYFSFFAASTKNLANAANAAVYGREVALDYQLNDNIGGTTWIHAGAFGISPQDKVILGRGSQTKIRPRLRIENNQASNPPVVENFALSLFSRHPAFSSFQVDINAEGDDELSGEELFDAISEMVFTAEPVMTESILDTLHNKQMVLSVQPNPNITGVTEAGFDAILQLYMELLPT